MTLIEAQQKLLALKLPIIQTSDASACLKITRQHASKILERLALMGIVTRITQGVWAFVEKADLLMFPEYLTAPFPAYVSLQTALFHHGMISQIPEVVYAVSVARTRNYSSSLGTISVHHITPSFFFGFEVLGNNNIKIASPEKALLDLLYLNPARSLLFKKFPELELPKSFNIQSAFKIIEKIPSLRVKTIVTNQFQAILHKQSS